MAKKPVCEELRKRVKELEKELVKSRQAQKALRASEKKYRTFFDNANDAVFIADVKTGVILDANKGAERLLGRSRRKIIGMHQSQLHPADKVKYYTEKFRKHVRNNRVVDFEAEIVKKDGTTVPVCISAGVMELQGKKVIQGIFGDITERKLAEERVEEQLRFLQTLIDTLPTPIFYKDKDGKYTGCNKAFEEFVGRPREKIIGKTVYDMGPKRIADKYYEKDRELFQNPGKQVYEWKVKRKSGELREVVFNKATFTDADGKIGGLIGGISDITERKWAEEALRKAHDELERRVEERTVDLVEANEQLKTEIEVRKRAEEALRESEKKYSTLVENSLTGIYIDYGGKIVFANNKFAEIYKYLRDELIGMESWKLVHPEDRVFTNEVRAKRLNGEDAPLEYEARGLTKDGETIWLTRRNTRIDYKGKPAILGNVVAITKRKQAEEALHTYHEKLQSLASKLSLAEERQRHRIVIEVHDHISQYLAFVKMKLGALRPSIASGGALETMDEVLKLVDKTIQNTRALISELGSPVLYELGFVPAVEWLTQQAQRQHGIVVDFDDDGQPKPLSEDVCVLLFQAVRELLVNIAKYAQARTAKVSITRSGDQVRVEVADDGVGFDSAAIGPSVDTTGRFGLFSIRVRLEPLGGHMEVESKPGHGTRVTLVAPLKHKGGNKKEKVS